MRCSSDIFWGFRHLKVSKTTTVVSAQFTEFRTLLFLINTKTCSLFTFFKELRKTALKFIIKNGSKQTKINKNWQIAIEVKTSFFFNHNDFHIWYLRFLNLFLIHWRPYLQQRSQTKCISIAKANKHFSLDKWRFLYSIHHAFNALRIKGSRFKMSVKETKRGQSFY